MRQGFLLFLSAALFFPLASAGAQTANYRIVPGKGVGGVALGMSRADVLKQWGKPTSSFTLRSPQGGRFTGDVWSKESDEANGLLVVYRNGLVAQIEVSRPQYKTAAGVSSLSLFPALRRRYPRLQVSGYSMVARDEDGGYFLYIMDDVQAGIAFTAGTQDDISTYEGLPKSAPASVVVHAPGRAALPIDGYVYGSPDKGSASLQKMQAWFRKR